MCWDNTVAAKTSAWFAIERLGHPILCGTGYNGRSSFWSLQYQCETHASQQPYELDMNPIPQSIIELVDVLGAMPGTVGVVLGGSRAVRSEEEGSDWDLGVYYRGKRCRVF